MGQRAVDQGATKGGCRGVVESGRASSHVVSRVVERVMRVTGLPSTLCCPGAAVSKTAVCAPRVMGSTRNTALVALDQGTEAAAPGTQGGAVDIPTLRRQDGNIVSKIRQTRSRARLAAGFE